tara:strand:+ start:182 stop:337 length:156 start_codon:yes stop_codon:yes gene_type:complete
MSLNILNLDYVITDLNNLKEAKKLNLIFYEVSKDVNKLTNNVASLIQLIKN